MLTIRDDALSLDYLRTQPTEDEFISALLDEDSFAVWDETFIPVGKKMVNDAVKRTTGATLEEVFGLVALLDDYESAIRYDCLEMGMRLHLLGTKEFTWGELLAIVQNSPRFSAFNRARNPDEWMWDETNHLLAANADAANIANWQRSGGKKNDKPRPIKRPGVDDGITTYGKGAMSQEDMAAWLGWS